MSEKMLFGCDGKENQRTRRRSGSLDGLALLSSESPVSGDISAGRIEQADISSYCISDDRYSRQLPQLGRTGRLAYSYAAAKQVALKDKLLKEASISVPFSRNILSLPKACSLRASS